jgi:flagellar FliL protein
MAEEKEEAVQPEENGKPPKDKKKLIIIIVIAVVGVLVLGGGGYFGYKMLTDKDNSEKAEPEHETEVTPDTAIVAFDPFILNLADRGRYLKLAIQVELADQRHEQTLNAKIPQLRDAIIMLISDKSAQSIASAEGKFQLKEEILYRVNYVVGLNEDVITNIYFTNFVMQ